MIISNNFGKLDSFRIPHISWQKDERGRERDRWVDSKKSRRGWTTYCSRNLSSSSANCGNDERNSDFSREPKGGDAPISERHRKKCSLFRWGKPGYFMYIGPGSEKTWNFEKVSRWPRRKIGWTGKGSCGRVSCVQKHPILNGCTNFQRGELKKGGANMHFHADDSSVKIMMDLISSASDICIVFGIYDYLRKVNEIDLESQRNTASFVLTPRVSENLIQHRPRPYAAEKFFNWSDRGGKHRSKSSNWENSEGSTAEGKLLLLPKQQTRKAFVERTDEKTHEKFFACVKL